MTCSARRRSTRAAAGSSSPCRPPRWRCTRPTGPRSHELYLLCDDIEATHAALTARGVVVEGGISDQGWGRLITLRLPGGGALGVYEPRHPVAAGS